MEGWLSPAGQRVRYGKLPPGTTIALIVHQNLDSTITLTYGPHRLGRYTAAGRLIHRGKRRPEGAWKDGGSVA